MEIQKLYYSTKEVAQIVGISQAMVFYLSAGMKIRKNNVGHRAWTKRDIETLKTRI